MIPYAARSFTDPAGFMNSAFPRISQPASSDRRRSRINGVFPTYPSTPKAFGVNARCVAVMSSEFLLEIVKPLLSQIQSTRHCSALIVRDSVEHFVALSFGR